MPYHRPDLVLAASASILLGAGEGVTRSGNGELSVFAGMFAASEPGKALRTAVVRIGCIGLPRLSGRFAAGFLFVSASERLANATICRF